MKVTKSRSFSILLVVLLSISSLVILNVKAQQYDTIIINSDGSINPINAPLTKQGNVYTVTADYSSLTVKRNNSILDGNGHTFTGMGQTISVVAASNVTIKNFIIIGSNVGISLDTSSNITVSNNTITEVTALIPEVMQTAGIIIWRGKNHTITGNQIANNYVGIWIGSYSMHNLIVANNILNNNYGISVYNSSDNTAYHNNFINNTQNYNSADSSINQWDKGTTGNYWNNYNGSDNDRDGIGDSPYIIDENNQDNYPLMNSISTIEPTPTPDADRMGPPPDIPEWVIWILIIITTVAMILLAITLNRNRSKKRS